MSRFRIALLIGSLVPAGVATTAAQAQEFLGLRYRLPSGWTETDTRDVRVLTPAPGRAATPAMGVILAGVEATTREDNRVQLGAIVGRWHAGLTVTDSSEIVPTDLGSAGTLLMQRFDIQLPTGGSQTRFFAVVFRGRQRGIALMVFSSEREFNNRQRDIRTVLSSLEIGTSSANQAIVAPAVANGMMVVAATAAPSAAPPRTSPPASASPAGGTTRLPTGDTPDLYAGSPGWLPSGRGVPIPTARIVNGRPQGLWWYYQADGSRFGMSVTSVVFLPDGVTASSPRFGAGELIDVEGQRAQRGNTGVGTFTVSGGVIEQDPDGFLTREPFTSGTDGDGPFFKSGGRLYRALRPATRAQLLRSWQAPGTQYVFRADGTYLDGTLDDEAARRATPGARGRWQLDGYLLEIRPNGAPSYITTIGATADNYLVIGNQVFNPR